MIPAKPVVEIAGDRDGVMARNGWVVGYSRGKVVWCFGFLPGSDSAVAYGFSVPTLRWALAKPTGEVIAEHDGRRPDLPRAFVRVLANKL